MGSPAAASRPAATGASRLPVRIDFEPALTEPGRLEVEHECGERTEYAVPPSGVDLWLLPGPVALTLFTGGHRLVQALRIEIGMEPFIWLLPSR